MNVHPTFLLRPELALTSMISYKAIWVKDVKAGSAVTATEPISREHLGGKRLRILLLSSGRVGSTVWVDWRVVLG